MSNSKDLPTKLSLEGIYTCPVCRYGEISALALMDAFACNFCQHILSAEIERQSVKMADVSSGLGWYWNGRSWQASSNSVQIGWEIKLASVAFVLLPTTLMGLAAYIFPPIPGSAFSWFPLVWTGLTFFCHLGILISIFVDYYQFPLGLYLRAVGRNAWARILPQNL
jgi:hypothetical protein